MERNISYKGNPLLKAANVKINFTPEQIKEYQLCASDPLYFAMNYMHIVNVDDGLVKFDPYDYQKRMISTYAKDRFVITKLPRQSGKSTSVIAFLLWRILFTPEYVIAVCAHKGPTARELLGRLMRAYELLPKWLQQGVLEWNKGSIKLENGSKIIAAATTSGTIRGGSFNLIFLDEFAFIPPNIADEFFASVYPTITSGKTTQVVIVSTPNGMNHFYKFWMDAIQKESEYVPIEIDWRETPGRDDAWRLQQIRNTSEAQFAQEFECLFLGGENTLINPVILRQIAVIKPIASSENIDIFEKPIAGHNYVIVVDTARGVENDASAFVVMDVTKVPYKMVCKFNRNDIPVELFPDIIFQTALRYNHATCLVEINDMGGSVADILYRELEYENLFMTSMMNGKGQKLTGGFGKGTQLGVRTTMGVKRIGCAHLKSLVEDFKLIVNDFDIIKQFTQFIQTKNSFKAEDGAHDDLVMCLVLFAWCVNQQYFKELMDVNLRERILADNQKKVEDDLTPFGIFDDHSYEDTYDWGDDGLIL